MAEQVFTRTGVINGPMVAAWVKLERTLAKAQATYTFETGGAMTYVVSTEFRIGGKRTAACTVRRRISLEAAGELTAVTDTMTVIRERPLERLIREGLRKSHEASAVAILADVNSQMAIWMVAAGRETAAPDSRGVG